ncbi:MAG: hypothetical protein EHM20_04835, partial [Alphaproteobacteria bacterium]
MSALYGNAAWFHKLKSEGVISKWLSNGDSNFIENHVLYYLISLVENQQKDVAELLSAYADGDTVWLNRLFNVLSRVTRWNSYDAAELLEKVVYRLPTISRYGWYEIVNVAKAFPKIGCRLILYAFNYHEKESVDSNQRTSKKLVSSGDLEMLHGSSIDDAISSLSLQEPEIFLQTAVPWILDVLGEPKHAAVSDCSFEWDSFCYGWNAKFHEVQNALIFGLINSLALLEKIKPTIAQNYIDLFKRSPFMTPQRLVARVFTANPEMYKDQALEFLCKDQRRLELGENAQYDSRRLVNAIYPFLSKDQQSELEEFIL